MLWTNRLGLGRGRITRRPSSLSRSRHACRPIIDALEARRVLSTTCPTISGYVYHDLNNNGLYDPSEISPANAIAGSKIELYRGNTLVASTITDSNGYYSFDTDATVSTSAQTVVYSDSVDLSTTNWQKSMSLPQFDPSLGTLVGVTVSQSGRIQTRFGLENMDSEAHVGTLSVEGTLSLQSIPGTSDMTTTVGPVGTTFNATAYDGTFDFGGTSGTDTDWIWSSPASSSVSIPAAAWASYIGTGSINPIEVAIAVANTSGAGNFASSVQTKAEATATVTYEYIPNNCLKPGDYVIKQAEQPDGYLDGQETRGNVTPIPNSGGGPDSIPITLGTEDLPDNNFGEIVGAALGDFVWKDIDRDGIQDADEPGIQGVTVTLTGTDDLGTVTRTLNTDANGNYLFSDLRPGTYQVTFGAVSGLTRTVANAGSDDALDSDADPTTGTTGDYILGQGDLNLTVDAGYVTKKSGCDNDPPPPPKDDCGNGGQGHGGKDHDHDKDKDKDCDRDKGGHGGWHDRGKDKNCDRDKDRDRDKDKDKDKDCDRDKGGHGGWHDRDKGGRGGWDDDNDKDCDRDKGGWNNKKKRGGSGKRC